MLAHLPALDGLRGVAILMVILSHVAGGWSAALSVVLDTNGMPGTFVLSSWLRAACGDADHGVQLFFVVSAFTLTVRAGGEGWRDLSAYAVRRIARVGPGYWLAGLGYVAFAGLAPRLWAPQGVGPADLAVAALFGSAWQGGASLAVVPGGWSISCEVTAYAALPLVLRVLDKRTLRGVLLTGAALLVAQVASPFGASTRAAWFAAYVHPIGQAPAFLCGVTAALVAMQARLPRIPGAALGLLALATCALPLVPFPRWGIPSHLPFSVLAGSVVLFAAMHPPRLLTLRVMRRIGEVSYSMYLLHFAVLAPSLHLALWLAPASGWRTLLVHLAATGAASFAFACVAHALIEQPAIRWAAAYTRRSGAATTPQRLP